MKQTPPPSSTSAEEIKKQFHIFFGHLRDQHDKRVHPDEIFKWLDKHAIPPPTGQSLPLQEQTGGKFLETENGVYIHRNHVEEEFTPQLLLKLLTDGRIQIVKGQESYFKTLKGVPTTLFNNFLPSKAQVQQTGEGILWHQTGKKPEKEKMVLLANEHWIGVGKYRGREEGDEDAPEYSE